MLKKQGKNTDFKIITLTHKPIFYHSQQQNFNAFLKPIFPKTFVSLIKKNAFTYYRTQTSRIN